MLSKINLYKQMHKQMVYGRGNHVVMESIKPIVKDFGSMLDYGCGQCPTTDYLDYKGEYYRYDPAITEISILPNRKFDIVICLDVLEHIPEEELEDTFKEIFTFSDKIIFNISLVPAINFLPNGEQPHCTLESSDWWLEKLSKFWQIDIIDLTKEYLLIKTWQ